MFSIINQVGLKCYAIWTESLGELRLRTEDNMAGLLHSKTYSCKQQMA